MVVQQRGGGCWPTRKTCYRCGKHRDLPVLGGVPPVNAAEPTIQQQVKEYEKSLRETVQKGAPSFSVPNRPANQGPNAWRQGNPWAAKKKQLQQPKVQVVMHPKGMALEELVQLLTLCGAGAEVLTKVQGIFLILSLPFRWRTDVLSSRRTSVGRNPIWLGLGIGFDKGRNMLLLFDVTLMQSQSWSVLCSNSYRKAKGKWPTLHPAAQNPNPMGPQRPLAGPHGP